jgi:glycine betaine/proline transport system substrate-binding protein
MKFIKKIVLSLVLLSAISLGASSAKSACSVHLGDFDWDSANIHTAITSFMIENGYGCDVEVTKGSTTPIMAAFFDNQIDVVTEVWEDNLVELLKPEFASGNIVHLGINTPASEQAFWVDRATAEAHGLKSVEDMKKPGVWELFKDPEDPSKGRMTSCISGWTCYTINFVKLKEYGLDEMYTNFDPGSGGALDAAIAGGFAKGKPVFSYYWTPTSLMGKPDIDMVRLAEPAYTPECWGAMSVVVEDIKANGQESYVPSCACEYKDMALTKMATSKWADANPDIAAMLNAYALPTPKVNEMLAYYVDESGGDMEATAMHFLSSETVWESWVSADVAAKIKSAL